MAKPPAGRSARNYALPDVLPTSLKLKVVFCGWAAGEESADAQKYYINRNNKFWLMLKTARLISPKFCPCEFKALPKKYGIGLTDVCKFHVGRPHPDPNEADLRELVAKIKRRKPHVITFHGKGLAQTVLKCLFKTSKSRVHYELQEEITIGVSKVWVLPDSSGGNRHWGTHRRQYEGHWQELADYITQMPS